MSAVEAAVAQRLGGERPTPIRAAVAAATVGAAAAVTTYKLLRG